MVRWAEAGEAKSMAQYVAGLLLRLRAAGAAFAALPAETPDLCMSELRPISPLPLVHLLEVVDDSVRANGFRRVALFGTRFTVESAMFGALTSVEVVRPQPQEIDYIHKTYFQLASSGVGGSREFCVGCWADRELMPFDRFPATLNGASIRPPHLRTDRAVARRPRPRR